MKYESYAALSGVSGNTLVSKTTELAELFLWFRQIVLLCCCPALRDAFSGKKNLEKAHTDTWMKTFHGKTVKKLRVVVWMKHKKGILQKQKTHFRRYWNVLWDCVEPDWYSLKLGDIHKQPTSNRHWIPACWANWKGEDALTRHQKYLSKRKSSNLECLDYSHKNSDTPKAYVKVQAWYLVITWQLTW